MENVYVILKTVDENSTIPIEFSINEKYIANRLLCLRNNSTSDIYNIHKYTMPEFSIIMRAFVSSLDKDITRYIGDNKASEDDIKVFNIENKMTIEFMFERLVYCLDYSKEQILSKMGISYRYKELSFDMIWKLYSITPKRMWDIWNRYLSEDVFKEIFCLSEAEYKYLNKN